jgi:hypothetical protein
VYDVPDVDLTSLRFVSAYGLVALTCLVAHNELEGFETIVQLPHPDTDTARYLSRMEFGSALGTLSCVPLGDLPPVRHFDRRDRLLELRRFSGAADVDEASNLVWTRLEQQHASPQTLNAVYVGLGEVADNVRYHAQSQGWIAVQTYGAGTREERIEVAIGDVGIGIRRALEQSTTPAHRPTDDLRAIQLALKLGVTSIDDAGRGQGLPTTMDCVCELGGTVSIRTGQAIMIVSGAGGSILPQRATPMAGTLIGLTVPCQP